MAGEDIISEILGYLEKAGPTNTFRLSSVMGMERDQLLSILKKLEEKQAIRFEYGNAVFLKFVSGEKPQSAEVHKISPPSEKAAKRKSKKSKAVLLLQTENTQLQKKLSELKETVKELEKKASARPKTITRTITKTVVKKVPVIRTVVKRIPSPAKKEKEKKVKETQKLKKKFKLPSFKLPAFTFMKNIKKLKEPKFVK